ncbi:MAG: glycosyltransferase [Thermodesulfobacteriota bacterium]|nr:glycosyltransferase [Thermodesulfobacteriota bacterium]
MGNKSKRKKKTSVKKHKKNPTHELRGSNKKPSISACMIVKNEEHYLDKCLKSLKDVADEIIIVDTGSEDGTVEIARAYTDKIYFHPWENNFSKHRNQSISYATGDWLFIIDADEELLQDDIPVLLKAVNDHQIDAIMTQIVSKFKKGESESVHNSERIFRNNGVIHYEGRVHNRTVGIKNAKVYPIRIIHYGYGQNVVQSKRKFDRTVSLLRMDLDDDPSNPRTHHYLGCSYMSEGMFKESLDASLTAIRLANAKKDDNMLYLWSRYNAAMSYYRLNKLDKAEEMAKTSLKKSPNHIDAHFILILVYFDQNRWRHLVEHGNEYIRLIRFLRESPEAFNNLVNCSVNEEWNVYILIGIAHFELDQTGKAEDAFKMATRCAPESFMALRAAGVYLYKKKHISRSRAYLEKAHQINPADVTVNELLNKVRKSDRHIPGGITISCCMIVKDEEGFLEQCLESVKDHVDEIVIVDTGSTDRTVEIAKKYTDKVYFHSWENNFSKARNQALQYAGCDWIFIMDADEELSQESGPKLRQAVREAGGADAIYVNVISIFGNGNREARHNSERLFKKNGLIHYEGVVHNRLKGFISTKSSKIELRHYGYNVEEKKAQEKFLRTTDLLKKQVEEEPDNPMPHHYLGASYLARNQIQEAVKESVLAIDLAERQKNEHPLYLWTHFNAAMAMFRMGDLEEARKYSLRALTKSSEHLDSYYMLTMIAAEKGDWEDARDFGNNYLKLLQRYKGKPEEAGLVINNTIGEEVSIHLLVGHGFHSEGNYDGMTNSYQRAYEISEKKWQVWWNIGTFHMDRSHDLDRARHYLNLALQESPDEHDVWYMLAKMYKKLNCQEEETRCLKWLFDHGSEDLVVLIRLASLCVERSSLDDALRASERARRVAPLNHHVLCNLGLVYRERNQIQEAIQVYMEAVENEPNCAEAWISLGEISIELNRLGDARTFFERVLSLRRNPVKVMLYLCEIEIQENNILGLLNWCDLILKELELDRNVTISNMEDVICILLEIDFMLRDNSDLSPLVFKVLSSLPVDYEVIYHTKGLLFFGDKTTEKAEFMRRRIEELSMAPRTLPPMMKEEPIINHLGMGPK